MPTFKEFTIYYNSDGALGDKILVDVDRIVCVACKYRLDDNDLPILDDRHTVITFDFEGSAIHVRESPEEVVKMVEEARKSSNFPQGRCPSLLGD